MDQPMEGLPPTPRLPAPREEPKDERGINNDDNNAVDEDAPE